MAERAAHLQRHAELDQRLVAATRGIHLLATVSWPAAAELEFVAAWKAARARLPAIAYPACDHAATRAELREIHAAADPSHPVGDYVRRTTTHRHHPVGTCTMGVGPNAVVDAQLRVRGIEGLRVADASVMPDEPSGNTNVPTIMIGEKAADMLRGRRLPPADI